MRSTREIGLRIALGALPRQVRARFVRQGLGVVAAGLVIGLAAALALTRLLDALLFEVSATHIIRVYQYLINWVKIP